MLIDSNDKISVFILLKLADPRLYLHKIFMYGWGWLSGEQWAFQSLLLKNPEEKKKNLIINVKFTLSEFVKSPYLPYSNWFGLVFAIGNTFKY